MFDIDEHPHVNRAIQTAADNGIGIAVSNPCLELWYLLHFREQTGWIERHAAQSDVATFITKGKSLSTGDLDRLIALFPQARGRAKHLATLHEANGNPPGDNPSSTVWTLVDCIRTSST